MATYPAGDSIRAIQECAIDYYQDEVMVSEMVIKKWASIYANDKFICVQTCSGLRRTASDPSGKLVFVGASPETSEVGQALQDALSASRMLKPEEIGSFFDVATIEKRYEDWVSFLMNRFDYSSRQQLFKSMKHCHVECSEGLISIRPSFHEKLEAWSGKGIEVEDYVVVGEVSSPSDVGEAVLLALSRCISRK